MSLQFNDTSTYKGICQIYEKETGFNLGDITGNTQRLKEFTADANLALDDFWAIAIQACGKWQFDDSNHTKYPIIYVDIVAGQRDYSLSVDEQSNLILDFEKLAILPSATATKYQDVSPIDAQSQPEAEDIVAENTTTGVPYQYDKTASGIFLDPVPSYSVTRGMKVYINREASYFTYLATTKMPGVPGIFHEYFAIKPALKFAGRNKLGNYADLARRVREFEGDKSVGFIGKIGEYFARREKDDRPKMTMKKINYI